MPRTRVQLVQTGVTPSCDGAEVATARTGETQDKNRLAGNNKILKHKRKNESIWETKYCTISKNNQIDLHTFKVGNMGLMKAAVTLISQ